MKIFIILAFTSLTLISCFYSNISPADAATVCCRYYRSDTGAYCSNWELTNDWACNTLNGQDVCGNVNGRALQNASMCSY